MNQIYPVSADQVCAVVTTYRPDDGFPERIQKVRQQVGLVVIMDDGNSDENVHRLTRWFAEVPKVILNHNTENSGIAVSLNIGVSIARNTGYKWILMLDDDSLILPNMVERLLRYSSQIHGKKPIALTGMSYVHSVNELSGNNYLGNLATWSEKRGIITSGSLFSIETYDKVGPFRDEFFIDSVDYDFCLRARRKGYGIIKFNEIGFVHSLGRISFHGFACRPIKTYNYSNIRLYYLFRNTTVLAKENLIYDTPYFLAVFFGQLKTLFKVLFLEEQKITKFRYSLIGLCDGLRNQMGKKYKV
jgi:rhamnosyltransferase